LLGLIADSASWKLAATDHALLVLQRTTRSHGTMPCAARAEARQANIGRMPMVRVKTDAVFFVNQFGGGGASVSKWARTIAERSVPEPSAYRRRAESGAVWPSRRTSAR